jgi:hypothetical protein
MNGRPHVIEIDSIVLTGVDPHDRRRVGALVEAEMQRRLSEPGIRASAAVAHGETSVAGEVARAVMQSLPGGKGRE